jgi:hypothetical protein
VFNRKWKRGPERESLVCVDAVGKSRTTMKYRIFCRYSAFCHKGEQVIAARRLAQHDRLLLGRVGRLDTLIAYPATNAMSNCLLSLNPTVTSHQCCIRSRHSALQIPLHNREIDPITNSYLISSSHPWPIVVSALTYSIPERQTIHLELHHVVTIPRAASDTEEYWETTQRRRVSHERGGLTHISTSRYLL